MQWSAVSGAVARTLGAMARASSPTKIRPRCGILFIDNTQVHSTCQSAWYLDDGFQEGKALNRGVRSGVSLEKNAGLARTSPHVGDEKLCELMVPFHSSTVAIATSA